MPESHPESDPESHLVGGSAMSGLPELALTRPIADRASSRRRDDLLPNLVHDPATRVLEVCQGQVRAPQEPSRLRLRGPQPDDLERLAVFLGEDPDGTSYLAVGVDEPADDPQWVGLRALAPRLDALDAGLMVQAVAVLNWHAAHTHCPRCGTATVVTHAGYARHCPADGSDHWPRTDPAVIMTVVDNDDRVLMGRHAGWPQGRFSTLAGFVEPGETLETAVRREVMEEVGVKVGEVSYLGSQPWPFPASIMLGFQARALTVDVRPDGSEIAEARWFDRDELLTLVRQGVVGLSSRLSISRALLEHWYGEALPDP